MSKSEISRRRLKTHVSNPNEPERPESEIPAEQPEPELQDTEEPVPGGAAP